jgi:glycerol uptake facilitator-like aquaporin
MIMILIYKCIRSIKGRTRNVGEGKNKMSTSKLARLFAELVGTFALTAVVIAVSKNYGNPLFTTIAAASAIAGLVSILGPVSGGHFNPAMTLGFLSVKKIKFLEAILYVAMQAVGAVLAWKLFEFLSPDRLITTVTNDFDWKVFTAEFVGTMIFAMGVAAVAFRKFTGGQAGAVVGLSLFTGSVAVAVVVLNRQLVTGVINPAVALGVGYRPTNQGYLAYFFGPVVGAVVGMNLYRLFFTSDTLSMSAPKLDMKPVSPSTVAKAVESKIEAPVKKAASSAKTAAKKTVKKAAPKRK